MGCHVALCNQGYGLPPFPPRKARQRNQEARAPDFSVRNVGTEGKQPDVRRCPWCRNP